VSIKRATVEQRKALPLASGVLDYFPDALLAVAEVSRVGNEQHHPGAPLHWDKSKSSDEADALMRHLLDRGTLDTDGLRHTAKAAWRALALLQRELDAEANVLPKDVVMLCACHTPGFPVGQKHVEAVRSGLLPTSTVRLSDLQATYLGMDLGVGPDYTVTVEKWGTGDGPVYRLQDVKTGWSE
jgi:hypothetical protein